MCALNIISGIILRCDAYTEHHKWNRNHHFMHYLSQEMHDQIQEILWRRGGGWGGWAFLFVFMPLAYTVPNHEMQVCYFEHLLHIDRPLLLHFVILAGVFKFLWFEESFRKKRDGLLWSVGQNLSWTVAQVEMV